MRDCVVVTRLPVSHGLRGGVKLLGNESVAESSGEHLGGACPEQSIAFALRVDRHNKSFHLSNVYLNAQEMGGGSVVPAVLANVGIATLMTFPITNMRGQEHDVALIGLHAVARGERHLQDGAHATLHARLSELPLQTEPGQAGPADTFCGLG